MKTLAKAQVVLASGMLLAGAVAQNDQTQNNTETLKSFVNKMVQDLSKVRIVISDAPTVEEAMAATDVALVLYYKAVEVSKQEKEVTYEVKSKKVVVEYPKTVSENEVPLYKATEKIELGEGLTGGGVYSISNELVFKDGKIKDKDNVEYYYTVRFKPSSNAIVVFKDKQDTEEEDPTVLIDGGSNEFYTIEVTFTPSLPSDTDTLEDKELNQKAMEIAGKKFYISEVGDKKIVLREASNVVTLNVGESYEFEGKKVELVDVVKQGDEYYAVIKVGDDQETIKVNDEEKVGGVDVKVLGAWVSETQEGKAYAKVILGGKKIELQEGNKVKVGGEDIDNTEVIKAGPSGFKIKVYVNKDDTTKNYLENGKELVDPVFGTFKLVFKPVDLVAGKEKVKVYASGEDAYIKLPLVEGEKTFKIVDGIDDSNNLVINEDWYVSIGESPDANSFNKLLTVLGGVSGDLRVNIYYKDSNGVKKPYFVVSLPTSRETYVYQVNSVTVDNDNNIAKVELKDVVTGNTFTVNVDLNTGYTTLTIGGVDFELHVSTDSSKTVVYLDKVVVIPSLLFYTKDGHKVYIWKKDSNVYTIVSEFQGNDVYTFAGEVELYPDTNDKKVAVSFPRQDQNLKLEGLEPFILVKAEWGNDVAYNTSNGDNTVTANLTIVDVLHWYEKSLNNVQLTVTAQSGNDTAQGYVYYNTSDGLSFKITVTATLPDNPDDNASENVVNDGATLNVKVTEEDSVLNDKMVRNFVSLEDNEFKGLDQWGTYIHGDEEKDGDGYVEFYVPNEKVWYDIRVAKTGETKEEYQTMELTPGEKIDNTQYKVKDVQADVEINPTKYYEYKVKPVYGLVVADVEAVSGCQVAGAEYAIAIGTPTDNMLVANCVKEELMPGQALVKLLADKKVVVMTGKTPALAAKAAEEFAKKVMNDEVPEKAEMVVTQEGTVASQ
ncbi:NEQ300 [Nanoarchaeum equitans Kin4-M]|uniref:NEQ300 n=1 Tax=Nanoarchaeum equitans (strain Kin4-M) TaxID=228908 RepID=Q74MU7_NANEQ|nr:NEQ300 [Nanoarchaeum equitans Kin4-M]